MARSFNYVPVKKMRVIYCFFFFIRQSEVTDVDVSSISGVCHMLQTLAMFPSYFEQAMLQVCQFVCMCVLVVELLQPDFVKVAMRRR
jgi:hypothetical protein